ncbi:MAG: ABC transporter substrate-binding protein [Clostridiales bacterium]|nr:ABC transporter substrate-binding protein [Clostridiales bacterium]
MKAKKAFTIVELIIVIAVIGVLAAILIPAFSNIINKANEKSALSDARNIMTSFVSEKQENSVVDNIVMIIDKANSFYVYAYDDSENALLRSADNPYKSYESVEALVAGLNYTGGDETGKAFVLSLSPDNPTEFHNVTNKLGFAVHDNVTIYEGVLLDSVAQSISGSATSGINFTDMKGREISLDKPAERIVALSASECEIIYALGAGNTLVGRGEYCDYPAEVMAVPSVQSGFETNIESIIALNPEVLIMATMNQTVEQVAALENAGITVVAIEAFDIEGVYTAIRLIGKITGKNAAAESMVSNMKADFAQIANMATGDGTKTIYFEVSPLEWGLWTAGKNTFMSEIANMLGFKNAFEDIDGWAAISEEQVIARNPDYIVTVTMYYGAGPHPVDEIKNRAGWEDMQAILNNHVFLADSDTMTRPGPRLVEGATALYEFIYE